MTTQNKLYPYPTIVVGVGKFGLSCLEFLGEKWISRKSTGGDTSCRNLRLLHLDYDEQKNDPTSWPRVEKRVSDFLSQVRTDDMPVQALNMLILRTMGLIRFSDGHFQACFPKDGGFISMVEDEGLFRFPDASVTKDDSNSKLYRRKYFRWVSLGTDPLIAVQNLSDLRSGNAEYDHFVGAILHRVRLGHSPNIILRMIFRSEELCSHGSDPSPWSWVHELGKPYQTQATEGATVESPNNTDSEVLSVSFEVNDRIRYAPYSVEGKTVVKEDIKHSKNLVEDVGQVFFDAWGEVLVPQFLEWNQATGSVVKKVIQVPSCNVFRTDMEGESSQTIYTTPYQNMYSILKQDFSNRDGEDALRLLPVSDFQLGMIDSDSWSRDKEYYAHLQKRLKEYGRLTYQGLLLLWSDLEQSISVHDFNGEADSHQEVLQKSIKQSLAFLGELLVKKHLFDAPSLQTGSDDRQPTDIWTDGLPLPKDASNQLKRAQVNSYSGQSQEIQELYERLIEIGVPIEEKQEHTRPLYTRIDFDPESLNAHVQEGSKTYHSSDEDDESSYHISDQDFLENETILRLRKHINAELRHLYSLDNLRSVNKGIHRTPPELKVFVVADFHDPFARVALQPLLKSISAEIFRTIHSVFQIERGGVWRNTAVVPLVWLPNPTDPTSGGGLKRERRNRQSAVSLYAIHSLRKWLESIPKENCNFRQIFLNSRMTDNAYLGTRDATTQTAHFIEYQITNQFGDAQDLDATKAFIDNDALFASFACQLIDFPETRTREYLATLLGLDFLERIRDNRSSTEVPTLDLMRQKDDKEVVAREETSQDLRLDIHSLLEQQAKKACAASNVRFDSIEASLETVFTTMTAEHLLGIKDHVRQAWMTFVSESGRLDQLIKRFHIDTEKQSQQKIEKDFEDTNRHFTDLIAKTGVDKARQFLHQQKSRHDEGLRAMDGTISQKSQYAKSQDIPKMNVLNPLFENIKSASVERLSLRSKDYMSFIMGIWLLIGSCSLVWMGLSSAELYKNPSVLEWIAWTILPLVLTGAAIVGFRNLLQQKAEELHDVFLQASTDFLNRLEELFVGETHSLESFFHSRAELSLLNKQREYNSNTVEHSKFDQRLGERFQQSVNLQETLLQQHLEELGVRLTSGNLTEQDPSLLYNVYSAQYNFSLLNPEIIRAHYLQHCPADSERFWTDKVRKMLQQLGDLDKWRVEAPLSNTEALLDYGRNEEDFRQFVDKPLINQDQKIRDDLFENIINFILTNHPNTGIGADFDGYRGLDNNNIQMVTCTLVLHEKMQKGLAQEANRVIEQKLPLEESARKVRTMIQNARVSKTIRANSVCLYSISTGISTRIIQNLKRYHTPLERVEPVLETLFPFGVDVSSYKSNKRHLNPIPPFGKVDLDWVDANNTQTEGVEDETEPSEQPQADNGRDDDKGENQ